MVGSCTNSTALYDSCWNSWYGEMHLSAFIIIGLFVLFVVICIGLNLKNWAKLLDYKPGKKKKSGSHKALSWPLWMLFSLPFFVTVYLLITQGLEKPPLFATYHVIFMAVCGIIANAYNRSRWKMDTLLPTSTRSRGK